MSKTILQRKYEISARILRAQTVIEESKSRCYHLRATTEETLKKVEQYKRLNKREQSRQLNREEARIDTLT